MCWSTKPQIAQQNTSADRQSMSTWEQYIWTTVNTPELCLAYLPGSLDSDGSQLLCPSKHLLVVHDSFASARRAVLQATFFSPKHSQKLIKQSLKQWFAHVTDAENASVTRKHSGQEPVGEADRVGRRAPGEVAARRAGSRPKLALHAYCPYVLERTWPESHLVLYSGTECKWLCPSSQEDSLAQSPNYPNEASQLLPYTARCPPPLQVQAGGAAHTCLQKWPHVPGRRWPRQGKAGGTPASGEKQAWAHATKWTPSLHEMDSHLF